MAKFKYSMEERAAILEVKKALNGKLPIAKDEGCVISVGNPFPIPMIVKIKFENGIVEKDDITFTASVCFQGFYSDVRWSYFWGVVIAQSIEDSPISISPTIDTLFDITNNQAICSLR